MAYKAPIWEDGKSPAISAENLNALSQAAEGAQVLHGNSAPTSSTEGVVGQFYLVVVADSDGNYPLYQCVAIANGSYTWRDTRRIPDSITSMLGIPAPGTINRALNVLANVGNLHVWERAQTYSDPVPAGYTLGNEINGFLYVRKMGSANKYYEMTVQYGSNIGVTDDGTVYISDATSYTNYPGSIDMQNLLKTMAGKYFKIVKFTYPDYFTSYVDELVYIPATATITFDSNINMQTDYQVVTGTPAIPTGTTTDYLTSTDRNAYPDQSAEGGKDAYYTLGDVKNGTFALSLQQSAHTITYKYSAQPVVNDDGTVSVPSTNTVLVTNGTTAATLKGMFIEYSTWSGTKPSFEPNTVYFIPSDAVTSDDGSWIIVSKYQPVTGHAAIPANTTITYLGQLGGGARIEVGSYVGTGTYNDSNNPSSITFGFIPKFLEIVGYYSTVKSDDSNIVKVSGFGNKVFLKDCPSTFTQRFGLNDNTTHSGGNKTYGRLNGKLYEWYLHGSSSASEQYNTSGTIYYYIAIG